MGSRWRRYADREVCVRRDYMTVVVWTCLCYYSYVGCTEVVFPLHKFCLCREYIHRRRGGIFIPLCSIILCLNIDRSEDGGRGCDLIRLGGVCERAGGDKSDWIRGSCIMEICF